MKKILVLLALTLSLSNCAGPAAPQEVVELRNESIIITDVVKAKYSVVRWKYELALPDGQHITLYGKQSESGYYYKEYTFREGDEVTADVTLYTDSNGGIQATDIDLSAYQR